MACLIIPALTSLQWQTSGKEGSGYTICKFNFYKNWLLQFGCSEECTPDSVIRMDFEVNIGSLQNDEVIDICEGSLIIKSYSAVTFSITLPS